MFLDKKSFNSDSELSAWQLNINTAHLLKQDVVAQYMPDLVEARIEIAFCTHRLTKDGGRKAAIIKKISGDLKFYVDRYFDGSVNFLIKVDYGIWNLYNETQRKAIIHHELKHVKAEYDEKNNQELKRNKKGEVVWHLVPHDKEEFYEVEAIYGAGWNLIPSASVINGEKP